MSTIVKYGRIPATDPGTFASVELDTESGDILVCNGGDGEHFALSRNNARIFAEFLIAASERRDG